MKIKKFRIQGFKSITDITVEGLSDINVFFGLNDVGKSNIFQALDMMFVLISRELSRLSSTDNSAIDEIPFTNSVDELENSFGKFLFQAGGNNEIQIEAEVLTERVELEQPFNSN